MSAARVPPRGHLVKARDRVRRLREDGLIEVLRPVSGRRFRMPDRRRRRRYFELHDLVFRDVERLLGERWNAELRGRGLPESCPTCGVGDPAEVDGNCARDGEPSDPWHVEKLEAAGKSCDECEDGVVWEGEEWAACENCWPATGGGGAG